MSVRHQHSRLKSNLFLWCSGPSNTSVTPHLICDAQIRCRTLWWPVHNHCLPQGKGWEVSIWEQREAELVGSRKTSWRRWCGGQGQVRINKAKRQETVAGLNALLKDLMSLQWQSWCDCCLCVGRRREKEELSLANWRLIHIPTWVRNEALGWHNIRIWSWETSLKPRPHGLQPWSKGRQGKTMPFS